jgi:simple sugar transport system permease protein
LLSGLRISLPLVFAALGGLLCEKSGVANIALESFLLFTSFSAAAILTMSHSLLLSIGGTIVIAFLLGTIFSYFTIKARADHIIVGTGLNILAYGALPLLCKSLFGSSGQTPSLDISLRLSSLWPFLALACASFILILVIFNKWPLGMRIVAAGDEPLALRTQGINVELVRFVAVLLGSALCAFGGIFLSIGAGSGYTRNMSAGRGFIALAALIFGRWKPWPTLIACVLFGLLDALQIFIQNMESIKLPSQFTQALPYLLTILALAAFSSKNFAPKYINRLEN